MVEHWVNHIDKYHECIIVEDEQDKAESNGVEGNTVYESYIED